LKKQLRFVRFAYQIVVDGSTIICVETEEDAVKYAQQKLRGAPYRILPVPLFSYQEEGKR